MLGAEAIAHHEAGHAVIARALGRLVALVTIIPSLDTVGSMRSKLPAPDAPPRTVEEGIRETADICMGARALMPVGESRVPAAAFILEGIDRGIELLAGPEAQRRLTGIFDTVAGRTDIAEARLFAKAIAISPECARLSFRLFRLEARALVNRYWHAIEAVAARLIERQTLTGDEVNSIIAEAEAAQCVVDSKARRAAWAETVARAQRFTELHGQLSERRVRKVEVLECRRVTLPRDTHKH